MNELFGADIRILKRVGDGRAKLFKKLGVTDVGALLRLYPRTYEDWTKPSTVLQADFSDTVVIKARITGCFEENMIRRGMTLYKGAAVDDDGTRLRLTFFNNRYIGKMLPADSVFVFRGKLSFNYGAPEMASPAFQKYSGQGTLVPVYPLTEGLASRVVAGTVAEALELLPRDMPDYLPNDIATKYRLCSFRQALCAIHAPEDAEMLRQARRRLVFDELLLLQLGLMLLREDAAKGAPVAIEGDYTGEYRELLPFELTGAQKRAIEECMGDMRFGKRPMKRLLQGDVGSGKTAVAAALCFCCAKCGVQSALMAPTEILAEQHHRTLSALLEKSGIRVALLTGSVKQSDKKAIYAQLESGDIDLVVGTHALISEGVRFKRLGLVITDEQHRFGVGQRAALAAKGEYPHMLVMSATPIPRTLALIIFGDLDISVLDEMPKGRLPVLTYRIDSSKRQRANNFIKKHIIAGEQAFIVCPLVSEGAGELKAAEDYAATLAAGEFQSYRVGLLHGKMRPNDKEYTMRQFLAGELDILVSTTVIEVGIDVPNATVMLIENADRFGLSQLHQLRGRVGRGENQSYCILVSDVRAEQTETRLATMVRTSDGFEVAAEDLKLRGPGDFFGSRQHGLPDLKLADLTTDMRTLNAAGEEAKRILAMDERLEKEEHRLLAEQVRALFKDSFAG